jgi:hypothetical protein
MFIEVSSNSVKRIINACEIVFIERSNNGSMIHFAHLVGNNGKMTMSVDQCYDELLSLLVGVKE